MTAASAVTSAEVGFGRLEPLADSFEAAVEAAASIEERDFRLAGAAVRLRSPNPEMLRRLGRAFAHVELADPVPAPDLVINLWDSASGGQPPPLPHTADETAPGAFFYFSNEVLRAGFQRGTSGDARVLEVFQDAPTPALSVLEQEATRGWYWVADAGRIPYWEEATPLVYLLDWWLRERDMYMLHAGAIGTAAGGVVLVGKSGSGKSTTALSSLDSDLDYAGDDYVGVSLGAQPEVHSFYSSGKLMQNHVERLPFLLDALANREKLAVEKAVVYVNERWPDRVSAGFPLRAVVVPRVTPGLVEARVLRASPAEAFMALAPSTVFQMHTRGQDSLVRARRLLETVPSYVLELGSDMRSIPRAVGELAESLGDGASQR
ncbi:MAG TPA: hypothetical protein VFU33_01665 [Gaiellaceae bacterium]|nr:hypothetical protein [Gaiellaceae bacterium]